ncbi:hypothetical protein ACFYTQ_20990 [Nocardia sp. NPDC004068]|uniref:AMIN-like domain-containing (lipo)protein n=1 Tax=Nocardia sp. NPDC004068 TaxID=3364303 RepID=UPI0036AD866E
MRNRLVFTAIAGLTLLTSCSTDSSQPAAHPAEHVATTSAAAAPPTSVDPEQGDPSPGARLTVTGVRLGHHPGFDRVVYELGGTGRPGWRVRYTDRAVQDGSGTAVAVAGRSILEVQILGSAYPWDSGVAEYEGPDPVTDPAVPGITGVYGAHVYEGATRSFIGIDADRPAFSVAALDNPARLVIDIATP